MPAPEPDPFQTPFFRAHASRTTVEIADVKGKPRRYTFPTFFAQTQAVMAVFTADLAAAAARVAPQGLKPVRVFGDRCLFALAAYRYGKINDGMHGYNEVMLGVPVSRSKVPLAPALLRNVWSSFGMYVLDLPVDSEENCHRGTTIWGLPKTMKTFAYRDQGELRTLEVLAGAASCLRFSWPRAGRRALISERTRVYSVKQGAVVDCQVFSDGACWQFARGSRLTKQVRLEWGDLPAYRGLAALKVSAHPLLLRDFDSLSTALYAPTA